ncbi:MAG: hypothetical protein K2P70_04045 [Hyphomonadaceae bacterium]|jgi:tellurite resistance protein TehA-like permease|nr:hypothetical protein [Hyphomonadaceae bacterium]
MLLYAFLLILLFRPSYGLLGWFSAAFAVLFVGMSALALNFSDPLVWNSLGEIVGTALINVVIFSVIGALIVMVRGDKSKSRSSKKLDKEMEQIRADIAAREGQQQPPPQ